MLGATTCSSCVASAACCVQVVRADELVCALSFERRMRFERATQVQQPSDAQTLAPLALRVATRAVLTAPYRSLKALAAATALGTPNFQEFT